MEKLLHDRLREYDTHDTEKCLYNFINDCTGCPDKPCSECNRDSFLAIADEIERYYITRPRFEDGEPVQFGDKFLRFDGLHGNNGENVTEIAVQSGDFWRYKINGDYQGAQGISNVKRPTPKVYDADGVEIKVGETLWRADINQNDCFTVKKIASRDDGSSYIIVNGGNGYTSCGIEPTRFTHERPVFDADGVRICKGDTVWSIEEGKRHKVLEPDDFVERSSDIVRIGDFEYIEAILLTHREPDSLSKIQQFASEWAHIDNVSNSSAGDYRDAMEEVAERLTALIERGA